MFRSLFFILIGLGMASCHNADDLKREQYFSEGYQLYTTNCANCHQADGKGMASLYPPLSSASILANQARLACIIKNGMKDTIMVEGKQFSRPMPPNQKLTDLEIAEIITFLRVKWAQDSVYTSIDEVTQSLINCEKTQGPTKL
jgi:mono/diheme cytochrome c family protein